ncbi:hypothetical protein [Burkholderia sp. LA-2-3-30-S1-D2]|uniref:hypothetical protein n=1 Tax=Burkholderia sp. LA-2-3-30-S1-D2 TaxID=1637862 RepID=UPI000A6C5041|nr:hypothetical protein [Burkholderia sp. LA-2-3-30-S1-D2]
MDASQSACRLSDPRYRAGFDTGTWTFLSTSARCTTRGLQTAIDSGRLQVGHVMVARDIVLGAIMCGIETLLSGAAPEDNRHHARAEGRAFATARPRG